MEVALARPRTEEEYLQGLRDGLKLTERVRELVEAIREVEELEDGEDHNRDVFDLVEVRAMLQEAIEDLTPVAEEKRGRIVMDCSAECGSAIPVTSEKLRALAFRLLESVVSLARQGTDVTIETGSDCAQSWLRLQWQGEASCSPLSRAEIGLLVAQAGWERLRADWERHIAGEYHTVVVRFRAAAEGRADSQKPNLS